MITSLWALAKRWGLIFIIITAFLGPKGAGLSHSFLIGAYHWASTVLTGHPGITTPHIQSPIKK